MSTNDDLIEALQEFFAYVLGDGAKAFADNPERVIEEHDLLRDPAELLPALESVTNQVSFDRNVQQGVNNTSGGGGGGGTPHPPQPDPSKPPAETMKEYVQYFETNNYETHNFYNDESINTYAEEGAHVDIDRIDNEDGVVIKDSEVDGPVNNVDGDGNIVGEDILKDVTTGQNSPIIVGDNNETKVEDQDVDVTLPVTPGGGYGSGVQVAVTGGKDNESHTEQEIENEDEEPAYPVEPLDEEPIRSAEPAEEDTGATATLTYEQEPEQESENDLVS